GWAYSDTGYHAEKTDRSLIFGLMARLESNTRPHGTGARMARSTSAIAERTRRAMSRCSGITLTPTDWNLRWEKKFVFQKSEEFSVDFQSGPRFNEMYVCTL